MKYKNILIFTEDYLISMKFFYSKSFIKQIFLAVVIFSVIILLSILFLFFYTNQTSKILVPNLIGYEVSEIQEIMDDNKLRYEIIDSSFYNPNFEKNTILEQIPEPSKTVKKNRKIYLTVNPSSYGNVIFPDLIQLTLRNAQSTLSALDLEFGEIDYEDNIGKDMVLKVFIDSKQILSGEIVPKKSKIDFIVGNGIKK
ncbi:MAG: PASTA domain-containing protein [Flavobacteriaceae bacterium]|nr:PASTA domain-containing protein [Flavobacteriaceae bacterium]MBL6680849.1 PASTA domain-containing protein [Flavobacteriaceae bacterium]